MGADWGDVYPISIFYVGGASVRALSLRARARTPSKSAFSPDSLPGGSTCSFVALPARSWASLLPARQGCVQEANQSQGKGVFCGYCCMRLYHA
jgi:hypothetical protein